MSMSVKPTPAPAPAPVPGRQLVKTAVILRKLDISDVRALDKLIENEGLPCHVLGPRTRRFDPVEVDAWIDARCSSPAAGEVA